MNAEQASKKLMRKPTQRCNGEGRRHRVGVDVGEHEHLQRVEYDHRQVGDLQELLAQRRDLRLRLGAQVNQRRGAHALRGHGSGLGRHRELESERDRDVLSVHQDVDQRLEVHQAHVGPPGADRGPDACDQALRREAGALTGGLADDAVEAARVPERTVRTYSAVLRWPCHGNGCKRFSPEWECLQQ